MGIFDRFRSSPPEPEPDEPVKVTEEDIRIAVEERILPGFSTRADAVEAVTDYLELEDDPRIRAAVDDVWSRRLTEEAAWATPGDYAKVASAFAELAGQGILGRMNFTCCQTCGTAEIDDERTPREGAEEGEYPWQEWGYTFFHQQDAERLTGGPSTLYLSYSTFCPAPDVDEALIDRWRSGDESAKAEVIEASDRAVGRRVSDALREQGLSVEWDGDTGQRIAVSVDDWRKPLPR